MIAAAYIAASLAFYLAFIKLELVGRTVRLMADFRAVAQVFVDPKLSDFEKERHIRGAAISTLGQSVGLVSRLVVVLAAAALPVLLTFAAGLDLAAFMAFSLNPVVLIATMVALAGLDRLWRVKAG